MTIKHLEAEKKLPKRATQGDKERSKAIANLLRSVVKLRTAVDKESRARKGNHCSSLPQSAKRPHG